jgi:hypothetical protein
LLFQTHVQLVYRYAVVAAGAVPPLLSLLEGGGTSGGAVQVESIQLTHGLKAKAPGFNP